MHGREQTDTLLDTLLDAFTREFSLLLIVLIPNTYYEPVIQTLY